MGVSSAAQPVVPSGIVSYSVVTINNTQTSATPAPFQSMVNITESSFSGHIVYNNNFANFEYFYANGTIIPSWIESNTTGKLITWVKLNKGIPASSTAVIYLGFASTSTNLLSNTGTTGIGEAPQLSSTYAEYDDGASVFSIYVNGNTNPSDFSVYSNGGTLSITQKTGVTIGSVSANVLYASGTINNVAGDWNGAVYTSKSLSSGSYIAESNWYDLHSTTTADTETIGIANSGTSSTVTNAILVDTEYGGSQFNQFSISSGTGTPDQNPAGTYAGLQWLYSSITSLPSSWIGSMGSNLYSPSYTGTLTTNPMASQSVYLAFGGGPGSSTAGSDMYYNWLRIRAYPPNGVMPSVSFGAVHSVTLSITPNPATYGQSITLTATCLPSTDSCAIDYPSLGTAIATGTGTATYTYNAFALGAGTYGSFYANDITAGTNSTPQTLTVNKNSTYAFTLTGISTGNLLYTGTNQTATATIATHNNQLLGTLYLNTVPVKNTTTALSYNSPSAIGNWDLTFNTTGNPNYTAKSLSANYINYVAVSLENITKTSSITPANLTVSSYYPIKLYTTSPANTIIYSLNQTYNSITTALQSNVLNISYIPPANQLSGNYVYNIKEMQGANKLLMKATIQPINMTSISSAINYSTLLQYLPILAHTPAWTAKPQSWYISSTPASFTDQANTTAGAVFQTNASGTMIPQIHLVYPFTSFVLNYSNNPAVQGSVSINPFTFTLANSIAANYRSIANFSVFSQYTFNGIPASNLSVRALGLINGYHFNISSSNTSTLNGKYYLAVPTSNYLNPNITYNMTAVGTKANYFSMTNNFCPTTASAGAIPSYPIGLVDANGTRYSIYAYSTTGGSSAGNKLQVIEQHGSGSQTVQELTIPASLPFALPLEQSGIEYAFNVYSSNCKTLNYKGALSVPTNPLYIQLAGSGQITFYNKTLVNGICKLTNTTATNVTVHCSAGDPNNYVYKYNLQIENTTILGSQSLAANYTYNGSSFTSTFSLPKNATYYYYLYAYAYKNADPKLLVNSNMLTLSKISLAAPILGFIAAILLFILAAVGVASGVPLVLSGLFDLGLVAIVVFQLVNIPSIVIYAAIMVEIALIYWGKKEKLW
jgi:hypothetical protein